MHLSATSVRRERLSSQAALGLQQMYLWNKNGQNHHIGIVKSVSGGIVYTVEGNVSGRVANQSHPLDYGRIAGYGTGN